MKYEEARQQLIELKEVIEVSMWNKEYVRKVNKSIEKVIKEADKNRSDK